MTTLEIAAGLAALYAWLRKHVKIKATGSLTINVNVEKNCAEIEKQ